MAKHTSLGTQTGFFKKLREGSRVKQEIVTDYFVYYNRVMAAERAKRSDMRTSSPGRQSTSMTLGASKNPRRF